MTDKTFEDITSAIAAAPVAQRVARLVEELRAPAFLPYLFEVLNMQGRHERGLPLEMDRSALRPGASTDPGWESLVAACTAVGDGFVAADDLLSAWPYYRAGRLESRMASALDAFEPEEDSEDLQAAQRLDQLIQVAFNEGVHPIRGYELILKERGTCDGITTFERGFPHSAEVRNECAKRLIGQLHSELMSSLAQGIERKEGKAPSGDCVMDLMEGRPDLITGGYPIDDSHLQAVVRVASSLTSPEELEIAIDLASYGHVMSPEGTSGFEGPPFEDFYADYRRFLNALLGRDVDETLALFEERARSHGLGEDGAAFPAQVYVYLLQRVGRSADAVAAYTELLAETTAALKVAPSLVVLCEEAGDEASFQLLEEFARKRQDLVLYSAAVILRQGTSS